MLSFVFVSKMTEININSVIHLNHFPSPLLLTQTISLKRRNSARELIWLTEKKGTQAAHNLTSQTRCKQEVHTHIGAALKLRFISWERSSSSPGSRSPSSKEHLKKAQGKNGCAQCLERTTRRTVGPEGRPTVAVLPQLPPRSRIQAGWPVAKGSFLFALFVFLFL